MPFDTLADPVDLRGLQRWGGMRCATISWPQHAALFLFSILPAGTFGSSLRSQQAMSGESSALGFQGPLPHPLGFTLFCSAIVLASVSMIGRLPYSTARGWVAFGGGAGGSGQSTVAAVHSLPVQLSRSMFGCGISLLTAASTNTLGLSTLLLSLAPVAVQLCLAAAAPRHLARHVPQPMVSALARLSYLAQPGYGSLGFVDDILKVMLPCRIASRRGHATKAVLVPPPGGRLPQGAPRSWPPQHACMAAPVGKRPSSPALQAEPLDCPMRPVHDMWQLTMGAHEGGGSRH